MQEASERSISGFLREVYDQWSRDNAMSQGAALAYYTFFSMAPLLVLAIAIAGLAFGRAAAEGQIVQQIESVMGADGARTIQAMIARASTPAAGLTATAVSLATMLLGASGVFGQLQASLNHIWGVAEVASGGALGWLRKRVASFGMVMVIGFLLLVSLVLSAALTGARDFLGERFPVLTRVLPLVDFLIPFIVITVMFAMIYKLLPATKLRWSDVWLGAAFTALLFSVGKLGIAIYLGRAGVTSVYGAAGSLVLVLLWIYYSSQILLLGAEFTEVYSRRYGSRPGERPKLPQH
jgi:membrane protein